ncbi:10678_t:CDS:2, partial [Diversispora eburnea]
NLDNETNSEDGNNSDKNFQDSYTSDITMIPELADIIDEYLDNLGTNRQILKNQIKRATGQIRQPVIASANANVNNTFVDANKCDILKIKMAEKYTPVPGNDSYTARNSAINTPDTFLAWLKGKYSTETVGNKRIAKRFLLQEQFNSTDTPDMYNIPYADLLPYLYNHLSENIEVRMRMNSPVDINAFFNSLITICLSQPPIQNFQKMLQDEFNKQQSRSPPSNLKMEEDYKNYYVTKYFNDLGIYSKEDLDSNYSEKPFQRPRTQQKVNSTRLEKKVDKIENILSYLNINNQSQKPVAKLNRTQ